MPKTTALVRTAGYSGATERHGSEPAASRSINLPRGCSPLWKPSEPLTGRAQRVCANPWLSSKVCSDFEKALIGNRENCESL